MRKAVLFSGLILLAGPASAEWVEAKSRHFTVYADDNPDRVKQFVDKLERFDSAVRQARGVPDVEPGAASRVTIYQLRDQKEVARLYGSKESGVAGFYIPRGAGSVAFIPRKSDVGKWELQSDKVLFHEYTHHLMLQSAQTVMPVWLSEGFAEFFASPIFNEDGSVTIGAPPKHRAGSVGSMWNLSLEKMISGQFETNGQYDWVGTVYGQGWLLTHYLSYNLERRGQLTRYINAMQAGTPALKAATDSFGDLKVLQKELDAYLKRDSFTVSTIPADKLNVGTIAVRTLRQGEAEMMSNKIRLARGNQSAFAGGIAKSLAEIADRYGNDPAVLTTSAEADLLAKNYDRAAVNAAKAVALEPKNMTALLHMAEAKTAIAKRGASAAEWDEVRKLYARANRIDTENAAPLTGFYQTYVEQGIAPTPNAVDGLRYAVVLAPQDLDLRMILVKQLINDRKFKEAEEALAIVAYDPDSEKWHKMFMAILEPVQKGDQGAALTALATVQKELEKND